MSPSAAGPSLGFVGPHLGRHPGWVTTQSEVLSGLFEAEGFPVRTASSIRWPPLRAIDMVSRIWLWRRSVDVVSISVFSGRAFSIAEGASRFAERMGLPAVLVLHGGDLPQLATAEPERVRGVLARGAAVVAPSEFLARTGRELGLEVEVIPNVLDLADYRFRRRGGEGGAATDWGSGSPLRLLWMRTFHPIYRPGLALAALAELRSRGLDARLTLAGQDKGRLEACRRRARELGIDTVVDFPGFLGALEKARAFDDHDLFLNTNAVDNTPVTVLEAMASGLPVVAVAAGGLPDLLGGGDLGELVPEGSDERALARQLADRIEGLVGDAERVGMLSSAGRQKAEECGWPRVRDRWLELFERVVGSGGPAE